MSSERLYRVLPNLVAWRSSKYPNIEGHHKWKLPSIKCPVCGVVWGETAVIYPWIDASSLPDKKVYRSNVVCVMSPEEFEVARTPVAAMLPPDCPLPPGTSFGQFRGKHTAGKMEDFHFYYYPRLIASRAYEQLCEVSALSVGATSAYIKGTKKGETLSFLELHLVPRAKLAVAKVQKAGQKYCPDCGFDQRSLPEPLVILKETIPANEEMFQLLDDPGVVLAKDELVQAVKALALTGIEFEAVEVV